MVRCDQGRLRCGVPASGRADSQPAAAKTALSFLNHETFKPDYESDFQSPNQPTRWIL
jgi:hypothetical protein